ncbi:MAG TPA: ABC transporter substrate-binding protein [Blastocatellia bacterium]|jgi:peptide/nickel transport system substrate-binding protein|nr:ABC transporter substrate-binding protein [Blastocatellia bacterium]
MNRIIAVCLLIAMCLLAACTACSSPPPPGGPRGTPTPPFEGEVPEDVYLNEGEPGVYGGTLVMAVAANPKSFNPVTESDTNTAWVINGPLYRGLVDYDNYEQKDIPALAKSWEASPDGLTWIFNLRKGVKWSDGVPFTADDVMFTYQVTFDNKEEAAAASSFTQSDGSYPEVEKVDDYTVRFKLKEPNAIFIAASNSVYIIPKHKLEADYKAGKFRQTLSVSTDPKDVVSVGPYRLSSFTADQRVVLERNPYFWKIDSKRQRLPYIDRVIFQIVPDFNTASLKFQNGETDMITSISPDAVDLLKQGEAAGDYTISDLGPSMNLNNLTFNQDTGKNKQGKPYVDPVKLKWFRDVKFRQAVSYALDREGMVRTAFQGRGIPVYGFDSPANKVWYSDSIMKYPYNPEKAREMLREIGIFDRDGDGIAEDSEGNPVRFSLHTNGNRPYRVNIGTLIKDNLSKVGLDVNFQPLDANVVVDKLNTTRDFDAINLGWQSSFPPDPILSKNALLPSGRNYYAFPGQKTPSTDWEKRLEEKVNLTSRTMDLAERQKHYWDAMRIWTEYLPEIELAVPNYYAGAKNRFGNLKPSPLANYTYWNIEELFFTK